jgi:protein-S-isoprenylcysteine O-methyltransferase Ste14
MKGPIALIILIGWAVFWFGWLVAATDTKVGRTRWGRYAAVRLLLIVLVLVLIRGDHLRDAVLKGAWPKGVGLAAYLLGLGLAVWARVHIGRNWGTPMTRKEDPELITSGPYRKVRHPIYSGIVLAMIGTAVAVSLYWLIAAAVFGAYFVYSARQEERYMAERFPDSYPEYKRSTKMLIPFVF